MWGSLRLTPIIYYTDISLDSLTYNEYTIPLVVGITLSINSYMKTVINYGGGRGRESNLTQLERTLPWENLSWLLTTVVDIVVMLGVRPRVIPSFPPPFQCNTEYQQYTSWGFASSYSTKCVYYEGNSQGYSYSLCVLAVLNTVWDVGQDDWLRLITTN